VPKFGGVNFDLMDQVLPGLNNVARHIRPFVVVAWAWRRANHLAQSQGADTIPLDLLQDFVDRIEVIYVWSQLLRNSRADLPGRQVLGNLLKAERWTFGGSAWHQLRKIRRYSTALIAPINYGPGLKMLGWVKPHPKYSEVLVHTAAAAPALDAFEEQIAGHLGHPAFSEFGAVTVMADEARAWAEGWALTDVTQAEADAMAEMLFGTRAPRCRQLGGELILAAAKYSATTDIDRLRSVMAGPPSNFVPPAELQKTWEDFRRIQVRQLFRLSLEALFYWTLTSLEGRPKGIGSIVEEFLRQLPTVGTEDRAREWLCAIVPTGGGPTELMKRIEAAFNTFSATDLASGITAALAFCLSETPQGGPHHERLDRLPLSRAQQEAAARGDDSIKHFLRHVFESWILAQHVYWSVGRGLADARAQGKMLLRLRVIRGRMDLSSRHLTWLATGANTRSASHGH
jgi:hypothetical protein